MFVRRVADVCTNGVQLKNRELISVEEKESNMISGTFGTNAKLLNSSRTPRTWLLLFLLKRRHGETMKEGEETATQTK